MTEKREKEKTVELELRGKRNERKNGSRIDIDDSSHDEYT